MEKAYDALEGTINSFFEIVTYEELFFVRGRMNYFYNPFAVQLIIALNVS